MWRLWKCSYLRCTWQMLVGLRCVFALWALEGLRFHKTRKKPEQKGERKEQGSKMTWPISKLIIAVIFAFILHLEIARGGPTVWGMWSLCTVEIWLFLHLEARGTQDMESLIPWNSVLSACEQKVPNLVPSWVLWILTCVRAEFGSRVCLHICHASLTLLTNQDLVSCLEHTERPL